MWLITRASFRDTPTHNLATAMAMERRGRVRVITGRSTCHIILLCNEHDATPRNGAGQQLSGPGQALRLRLLDANAAAADDDTCAHVQQHAYTAQKKKRE